MASSIPFECQRTYYNSPSEMKISFRRQRMWPVDRMYPSLNWNFWINFVLAIELPNFDDNNIYLLFYIYQKIKTFFHFSFFGFFMFPIPIPIHSNSFCDKIIQTLKEKPYFISSFPYSLKNFRFNFGLLLCWGISHFYFIFSIFSQLWL